MKLVLALSCFLYFSSLNAQVYFEESAGQLGLDVAYGNGFMGGGISFYDFDNDGLDDISLGSSSGTDYYFFKNMGGYFQPISFAGIDGGNLQTKQVAWVDYNNDGYLDFFAASDEGLTKLFKNNQNGVFTDVTASCGFPTELYDTFGGAWGDYNNDGFLDVFLTIRDVSQVYPNLLYRNNGDGTFTDVTEMAGLEMDGYMTFCSAFFDYNNDGYQDIYMANDKFVTENILYKNNGDGTFENVSDAAGVNLIMGAMSTTIDDYNNDGWLDIYITNDDQVIPNTTTGNALLRNNGDGTFTNVAISTGTIFNSVGWGAVFLDADNDMDHDLYVSGSNTDPNGPLTAAFYENSGDGTFFIPEDAGFENDTGISFSNAIGDVDNDGYPEIVVLNNGGGDIFFWKNSSANDHNWLKVNLQGTISNKMGIGSWIEVSAGGQIQYHYTLCGEGYLGQNSGSEFFGLGTNQTIDYVKIKWLSGTIDYLDDVEVNQTIYITEGDYTLNINDLRELSFKIYPNPSRDFIIIERDIVDNAQLILRDFSGKELLSTTLTEKNTRLDIERFSSGIYLVEIISEAGNVTKKIVIE